MKSLRIYLRKSDMAGDYLDGGGFHGGCPIHRFLSRHYGKTHKILVFGHEVQLTDRLTGGSKGFSIVNAGNFAYKMYTAGVRKGTKIRIKGLTLPS